MKKVNPKAKTAALRKNTSAARAASRFEAKELDPRLALIARAFARDARVTSGGKGFGSGALKVDGKIFAMISARGLFVVKLSKERVSELVAAERGSYFDPGKGRLMKEWLALSGQEQTWLALAKEAHAFVLAGAQKRSPRT